MKEVGIINKLCIRGYIIPPLKNGILGSNKKRPISSIKEILYTIDI